jgi:hypothetical protein
MIVELHISVQYSNSLHNGSNTTPGRSKTLIFHVDVERKKDLRSEAGYVRPAAGLKLPVSLVVGIGSIIGFAIPQAGSYESTLRNIMARSRPYQYCTFNLTTKFAACARENIYLLTSLVNLLQLSFLNYKIHTTLWKHRKTSLHGLKQGLGVRVL